MTSQTPEETQIPNIEEIEALSEKIHHLYCAQYEKDNGEPYWTKGDYSKLDERTKEYDRNIARFIHHQLQKAREHELEVLAVHLDRQLVGYTSVSLDSIYRYIEERQKAIHSELDQDTDNDCPKHGNSEVAKQLFWEKPLTSHWGCRCKSELDQEVGITSEDKKDV